MTVFLVLVFLAAVLSGGTAAIVGFGIGSLLTPLLAIDVGMTTAVALVALPHAGATALRCWRLRRSIDWKVLRNFGVLSAVGGLLGALLYARLGGQALTIVLAVLLILTSIAGVSGSARWHPGPAGASVLGLLSGFFGGLAGNQGGLRSAAMLTFPLQPAAFVATATATALAVDFARVPVYLWRAPSAITTYWPQVTVAMLGVLIGTILGERILLGLSPEQFRRIVSIAIGVIGVILLLEGVLDLFR
jgi:uncharacterized protein